MKKEINLLKQKTWIGSSYKNCYFKDKGGYKKINSRVRRRKERQSLNEVKYLYEIESYEIKDVRSIINDWTVCDYNFYITFKSDNFYCGKSSIKHHLGK